MIKPKFDGPIPGENYTSDTKNYPWHRPPEITDMDKAIEFSMRELTNERQSVSLLSMLQLGVNVVQVTDMFVHSGVAAGKWTTDFALLLAGPVSHIVKLMADGYGIDYDMGLKDEPMKTAAFFKGMAQTEIDKKKAASVGSDVASQVNTIEDRANATTPDPVDKPPGGFMAMANKGVA